MDSSSIVHQIDQIPRHKDDALKNVAQLIVCLDYLATCKTGLSESDFLLDSTVPWVKRQLQLFECNTDGGPDLMAWIARNLMEAFFLFRYMYASKENYKEVVLEQFVDIREIEDALLPPFDGQDETAHYRAKWEALKSYGVDRASKKRPKVARTYAEVAGLLDDYDLGWRITSKYVHPSSYLLFGDPRIVYHEDVNTTLLVLVQYYAARNIRDLLMMVEKIKSLSK